MAFQARPLSVPDVLLIEPTVHGDDRGFFVETYKESEFRRLGVTTPFVQDNFARSQRHVLRGLHYQLEPAAQAKLVRVLQGEVFDVAVDLRRDSPTFGDWVAEVLTGRNHKMLYVPPGFAHGYVVLSDVADFSYKVSAEYAPELERGVRWDCPEIGIEWPVGAPRLSEKDRSQPTLSGADLFERSSLEVPSTRA